MIYNKECLQFMNTIPDKYYNIIYTDVPYNLGSKYIIDSKGHYRFKNKGSDFMNTWEAMDGLWWDKWFKESYRILKTGGFLITHNIDRQSDLWTYYARKNNFFPQQKLYWLFISNFPKGVDVALAIDNALKVERESSGIFKKGAQAGSTGRYGYWGKTSIFNKGIEFEQYQKKILSEAKSTKMVHHDYLNSKLSVYEKTVATSDIAKKYDGYKYGQAPLKQVIEEILIFWKPVSDTIPKEIIKYETKKSIKTPDKFHPSVFNIKDTSIKLPDNTKRWTPQLALSTELYPLMIKKMNNKDSADLTSQLQKIEYLNEELVNYNFCRKSSIKEKETGLTNNVTGKARKNTHPTPKPINLAKWVIKLFLPPDKNNFKLYDPFCGQGSILIAADSFNIQWDGTEINQEYFEIAKTKIEYYKQHKQGDLFV